ncbi:MAG: rod shape-determining protein MreC [Legionellales bacterium]|nr:rod shape-determining protein MreC [Legionellales bacterium]
MKLIFKRGPLLGLRLACLIIAAMILIFLDHRSAVISPLRRSLEIALTPLQFLVNSPANVFDELHSSLRTRQQLERENAKLHAQALLLEARVQKLLAIEEENSQLKKLVNSAQKDNTRLLVAELLAVATNPFAEEAVLDKGSMQGVFVGQPVLDAYGVMGQIIAVNPFTSRMMLISDPRSGVPVVDSRSGLRAIAKGAGSSTRLNLIDVPETADITLGDVFTTSGLAQRYPYGYPVGVVTNIQHNQDDLFATITLKPFARVSRSREVILIWPTHAVPENALAKQLMAMDKDQEIAAHNQQRVVTP